MSGPMSNLRKSRKAPLTPESSSKSLKNVPFRSTASLSIEENKLLDEVSQFTLHNKLSKSPPDHSTVKPKLPGSVPGDSELLSSMMSRLTQAELKSQHYTKEIIDKDKKIRILEDKVKILQKAREFTDCNRVQDLERKCLKYQKQIQDMEAFLADYGMMWVGNEGESDDNCSQEEEEDDFDDGVSTLSVERGGQWNPGASRSDFEMDFDQVISNIRELNHLAGDGIAKIQRTSDGARLKLPDPVQLTLYKNGIILFSGPFRSYSDALTQRCLKDIMDGYFPSELQDRYPDGVPFIVTDKRNTVFKDRLEGIFQGSGHMIGGEILPSRLVPSNLDSQKPPAPKTSEEPIDTQLPGRKVSMEQFLNKLPANVIKSGKVVDIRKSLGATLNGQTENSQPLTMVETPAAQELKDRLNQEESQRPPSSRDLTTLRVKSERGDHTYVLKMHGSDTIGDVRKCLNKQRPRAGTSYQIVATFPHQVFKDNKVTLKDCGLIPNATLHLKSNKR